MKEQTLADARKDWAEYARSKGATVNHSTMVSHSYDLIAATLADAKGEKYCGKPVLRTRYTRVTCDALQMNKLLKSPMLRYIIYVSRVTRVSRIGDNKYRISTTWYEEKVKP